jgi:PAS domain S-box-containing protein
MIRPSLQRSLIAFVLIFVTGLLGYLVPKVGGRLPLMLLPSGIAVAVLCRWGKRQWPAVFLAGLAIEWTERTDPLTALGVGAGLAGGAALVCLILDWGGFDREFRRARDVPLFVTAAVVGMTLAPGLARIGFSLTELSGGRLIPAVHWLRWWGNVTAGVLLVSPALIAVNRSSFKPLAEHWVASIVWILGTALCCAAVCLAPGEIGRPIIALAALILMIFGTIRFGLVISSAGAFAISTLTALSFEFSRGAFGGLGDLQGFVFTWTFVAALNFVCLSITALLAERDSAALAKLQAEHRYAEVFDGSPQPVWVHDRRTLRFLMINEAALRQYGWSREELLSMSVGALTPPGEPHWTDDQIKAQGVSGDPLETRHLTRDGHVIDVEVWSRSIDFGDQPAELVFAVDVTGRRAFGRALLDAIAGEQLRIGQEMHDGLGQELTGLSLSVRALANRAAREREAIAEDLEQLASLATNCIRDARLIVQGLTPLTDADGNLETALEGLARRSSLSGTAVTFQATHEALVHVDLKARNHLYRIAQEAVQNALKHSGATVIEVKLRTREDNIRLEIVDNGRGLSAENSGGIGLGMRTMRFRASAIGGRLTLSNREGVGNSVVCEVVQPRPRSDVERSLGRAAG